MSKSSFGELIKGNTPVLIDFSAEWCGPCKMLAPILNEVKNTLGNKVKIIKIDIEKNQQLASNYRVQSVPTMILFKESKQLWRQSGVPTKDQLIQLVQQHI
ncbi:MAG: thioredoxin [Cyclobacteriaceae bacterium]